MIKKYQMFTTQDLLSVGCKAIPHVLKKISSQDSEERCISLSIENLSPYDLEKPETHLESGEDTQFKPVDTISPKKVGYSSFHSSEFLQGTVGLLSYHISGLKKKLVILWSVPFDYNLYKNYINAKVLDQDQELNHDLFQELYSTSVEDKIQVEDHFFTINGMIGKDEKTILSIQFSSNFN